MNDTLKVRGHGRPVLDQSYRGCQCHYDLYASPHNHLLLLGHLDTELRHLYRRFQLSHLAVLSRGLVSVGGVPLFIGPTASSRTTELH